MIGKPAAPRVTRRGLLVGAAATGGLLIVWSLWPRDYPGALRPGAEEHGFGAWLTIGEDGVVTVAVPQLEMGQGVTTLLPQLVAHELGADWRQVAVLPVPPNGAQPNGVLAAKWAPLWSNLPALSAADRFARDEAFTATAEGTTLAAYEMPAREAGATARAMLAMAAAARWGVRWEECEVRGGLVMAGGKQLTFGALAAEAAAMTPPDIPPLRPDPPAERPIQGLDGEGAAENLSLVYPRLDLPAKVDGSMVFAGDVRLPGMVHAAIRHAPPGLAELISFDAESAARVRGVRGVVKARRWLAVAADSWWQAERALDAMRPRFGGTALDTGQVAVWLSEAVKDEGTEVAGFGGVSDALADGNAVFTATYSATSAVHATLETASVTARLADGKLELWIASQAPEAARRAAARAAGVSLSDVVLYPLPAGGSFDARLEKQHAIEVAWLARKLGRPVQLAWSRAEELKALPPRTPVAVGLTAKLDPATALPNAWRARIACPATVREAGERLFGNLTEEAARAAVEGKVDPLACEGAVPPYAIPNVAVEHCPVSLPFATGRLRGNSAAYTAFATEGFVDELARRAGRDPLVYRLGLLGDQPRLAEVLQRAARLGGWDGGRAGSGQGLALVRMEAFGDSTREGGGRIACIARARMGEGGLLVEQLTAVVDIGRIVNLDIARQQIEGGLLFGLGLAAGSSVQWAGGRARPDRLAGLALPVLATAPEIVVEFVASQAPPFDPGELGVAVAPPAIANALFAATGLRFRALPLVAGAA